MEKPVLLKPPAAADYIGVKKSTLNTWRCTRKHQLPYIKIGGLIQYDRRDLDAFLQNCKVE